jgi:hypothetical protein
MVSGDGDVDRRASASCPARVILRLAKPDNARMFGQRVELSNHKARKERGWAAAWIAWQSGERR